MRYVTYDTESEQLKVTLPEELQEVRLRMQRDLMQAFFGEPQNDLTAESMNAFVTAWLAKNQ